ncbi:MAG: SAM-dependent methyltransferase [Myxococcales bacterium]|jgi:methyltransferase (TIGR00027 family)
MTGKIEHVTDTAFWIASLRALESERPDAVFHDPLAAQLAGDKGRDIARAMSAFGLIAFTVTQRTTAIDRLVLQAIQSGVDTVLNLGAGLDTRPYRMALPESLRWFEADFPSMIELKERQLAAEQPRCALQRIALDLSVRGERKELLARVAEGAQKVLLLTEGVIPYLPDDEVARLAEDVRAEPKFRFWAQEYYGIEARRPRGKVRKNLQAAPFVFMAPDWFGFFEQHGFVPHTTISMREEALRNRRKPPLLTPVRPLMWNLGPKFRQKADRILGYTLLEPRRG